MTIDELHVTLSKKLKGALPGEQAQFEMAPADRPRRKNALNADPNPRLGAVLALFYEKQGITHLLLMKRNEYDGPHSGQVCFPGGKCERSDRNHIHTALREANEELNVNPDLVQYAGELSPLYIPPSRFLIQPVVGIYSGTPNWKADQYEVNRIVETPFSSLLNPDFVKKGPVYAPSLKGDITVPYFDFEGEKVWGATGMIINELKKIINE